MRAGVAQSRASVLTEREQGSRPAPGICPSARKGLAFYRLRHSFWSELRDVHVKVKISQPRGCAHTLWTAHLWKKRSFQARQAYGEWIERRWILHSIEANPGSNAWMRSVEEVQKVYPGTKDWLISCSDSEGGHGRWVPNSQGSGVGGWLQFYPSTFSGFYRHAYDHATRRGFRIPTSASSWYSPLGQALAGAWAITHGMRHHWVGAGC